MGSSRMSSTMYTTITVTTLYMCLTIVIVQGVSQEKTLTQSLLKDYVVSARPVKNDSKAVDVSIQLTLQQISKLSKDGLSATYWINMEWVDENLGWYTGEWDEVFENVDEIRLSTKDIWLPDIELYNMDEMVVVTNKGKVTWVSPYKITSSCKIDTTWFPFDEQICTLKFGSWVYNGLLLNLAVIDESGMDLSSYVVNEEWELMGAPVEFNEIIYSCCPEPYQDVTFTVLLRRRPTQYWTQVIIPCFTITAVSILTLMTPPSLPTPRFITIFLIFILFAFTTPKELPDVSILTSMLSWCYLTLFCVLIHSIIVTSIASPFSLQSINNNNKIFRLIARAKCCCTSDRDEKITEEETRIGAAKFLDFVGIIWISSLFFLGFGYQVLSAPVVH